MTIHREVRRSIAARSRLRTSPRRRSIAAGSISPPQDPVLALAAALDQLTETHAFDAGASLPGIPKPVVDVPAALLPVQADPVARSLTRPIAIVGADVRANLGLAGILSLIAIAAALLTPGLGPPGEDDRSYVVSDDVWPARHAGAARAAGDSEAVVTEAISLDANARH
jgi:hypothetical protein